jgi:hypothetical protein
MQVKFYFGEHYSFSLFPFQWYIIPKHLKYGTKSWWFQFLIFELRYAE